LGVKLIKGNIFTSDCQAIVNTINCVGVMGAGIALECRLRYPDMFKKYVALCNEQKIEIGLLWVYKSDRHWVVNFPTKRDWKHPSKEKYLHAGLNKFVNFYQDKGIKSIAFPLLGADKGGIDKDKSLSIMRSHLDGLDIDVEIYLYDPNASDDLFEEVKSKLLSKSVMDIAIETGIDRRQVEKLIVALNSKHVTQINQLIQADGVGLKTLEKIFNYTMGNVSADPIQKSLF
jgi:O-acetyl-ADP-ribose deacetylase (regulator of RNase III)